MDKNGNHQSHGISPPVVRRGLCMTCNNAPTCYYRKRRGGDALFCELFDDSGPSSAVTPPLKQRSAQPDSDTSNHPLPVNGLCSNCLYRHTCTLPRPESGVWHCELYR